MRSRIQEKGVGVRLGTQVERQPRRWAQMTSLVATKEEQRLHDKGKGLRKHKKLWNKQG
jgi:hypothetical protein